MSGHRLGNVIGGQTVAPIAGRYAPVADPSTGEVYAEAPLSDAEDVDRAVRSAEQAFRTWRDLLPAGRQRALLDLATGLERHAEELVALECTNTGKPREGAAGELSFAIDQLRFFAGAARVLNGRSAGEYAPATTSMVRREPIGVIAQITPWNYPILMAVWKIAPALAAGNTVVLKPSDTTPVSTVRIAEIASEFLPSGTLNVVVGDRDTGRALVAHPVPRMVAITGSTRAGMEVARAAADDVKRLHLELGGKAPVIVFDDADPSVVADRLALAGFYNAGQDCTAATRVLVSASRLDDMIEALRERVGTLKIGGPDESADLGPLNNRDQLARVTGIVDRLPAHARIEAGGEPITGPGYFYAPTVISGLRQEDEAIQTEIFGPVITVQPFDDEIDALERANGVPYGLASSVWTGRHSTALRMAAELDFGTVWINTHRGLVSEMPHGGFKHSGYGSDLSVYSLEEYTRVKHVMSSLEG